MLGVQLTDAAVMRPFCGAVLAVAVGEYRRECKTTTSNWYRPTATDRSNGGGVIALPPLSAVPLSELYHQRPSGLSSWRRKVEQRRHLLCTLPIRVKDSSKATAVSINPCESHTQRGRRPVCSSSPFTLPRKEKERTTSNMPPIYVKPENALKVGVCIRRAWSASIADRS